MLNTTKCFVENFPQNPKSNINSTFENQLLLPMRILKAYYRMIKGQRLGKALRGKNLHGKINVVQP
jgi:hypothetical protein